MSRNFLFIDPHLREDDDLTKALPLELEIDERTTICAHELINYEDDERRYRDHRRDWKRCKNDAVARFYALWNPVD